MEIIVQPKSISLLRAWTKVCAAFMFLIGIVIIIAFIKYKIEWSLFLDKAIILFGTFIPASLIIAWFVVVARRIERNVVWVANHDEIICKKSGKEFSRVRWNAINKIIHKRNRLVLVTNPRSGIWALNGVAKEDVANIKAFWEKRLKLDEMSNSRSK